MAFKKKDQGKARRIVIIIVCIILALSMTVPSVAMLLNRDDSSSQDSGGTQGTSADTASLLATSQGYDESFKDLKDAWRNSSNPDTYEETLKTNYDGWISMLYSYTLAHNPNDSSEIEQAYQLVIDSITDTQTTSTDPSSYDRYLAYAYYSYAFTLMSCASATGEDLSAELVSCYNEGIAYHRSALEYSYDSETAGDLATMLYWDGQTGAAIDTANEALAQDPNNASIWYNLGNYYYSDKQYDAAQSAYEKALEVDPEDTYGVQSAANSQLESLSNARSQS